MVTGAEAHRLYALRQLNLLDTPASESFDRITRMASRLFGLPIAAVSLTDRDRQWFKSRVGVAHWEIPRIKAPCAEVAATGGPLIVPDLLESDTYRDSLLASQGIRFYAAAPLVTRDGFGLGAMCVLGTEPRTATEDEMGMLSDLAAMVMAQIELQHAFGRIETTSGLPNRHQFLDDLHDQARDWPGELRSVVILEAADGLRLREALRVLGPSAVDEMIRSVAVGVRDAVPNGRAIYHVGPTQFAWVVPHRDEAAQARAIEAIRMDVAEKVRLGSFDRLARPVVGVASLRLGEITPEDVLRNAHNATQDARNGELPISVYSAEADQAHRRKFRLIADLRHALQCDGQLSLAYQPRIDLGTGRCVGAEALLRWTHPALGTISPAEFIPLVEQSDLARPLTDWVIAAALRQLSIWREAGIGLAVSVNVSATNLNEPDFSSRLLDGIASHRLSTADLEVEVTEGVIVRSMTQAGENLRRIREAGVKVAVDDFGTGYSSLSYLQELPADVIKIDQSFVRTLAEDERLQVMTKAMIVLARSLGFRVVAEGVETAAALAFLQDVHCEEAQGYLFSRPVAPEAMETWLGMAGPSRETARCVA